MHNDQKIDTIVGNLGNGRTKLPKTIIFMVIFSSTIECLTTAINFHKYLDIFRQLYEIPLTHDKKCSEKNKLAARTIRCKQMKFNAVENTVKIY